jgi:hypothetical protein
MTGEQQEQRGWMDEEQVERAIVLQVLRDDHPERWTRAELEAGGLRLRACCHEAGASIGRTRDAWREAVA